MVTTWPWFLLIIAGRNSLTIQKCEIVLTSNVFWIICSVLSRIGSPVPIPALLIKTVG
jgi:hypothetical protein